jgi:DNA-binding GntR family transcriptional regulator
MIRKSQTDAVYELIKAEIIQCDLQPGQQIAQPQLAERYQVGITPIREALQRLAQEGFLTPVPRFGYLVRPVTVSDIHEIYELRAILEPAAARLAAQRGSPEALQAICQIADFTYTFGDQHSVTDFIARNADFHRSIAAVAGNQRLLEAISRGLDEMARLFHLGLTLRDMSQAVRDEHRDIARAICSRDADNAEQVTRLEVARSKERLLDALVTSQALGLEIAARRD